MILCDKSIRTLLPTLVDPYDYDLINPNSLDIRVGNTIMVEHPTGWVKWDISSRNVERYWPLKPGEFFLVETLEVISIPHHLSADLVLKSSRAREGYEHSQAGLFDAGWIGKGTMEIKNSSQFKVLPLYPGLRIGQLIFHRLDDIPEKPYQGRYQHATGVEASKT
jgi:dCTP deaminase